MKYKQFLEDIRNKEYIKFFEYIYFPKDNQLWYKGNLYFAEFTLDSFIFVSDDRNKYYNKILNDLKKFTRIIDSGVKYKINNMDIILCGKYISHDKTIINQNKYYIVQSKKYKELKNIFDIQAIFRASKTNSLNGTYVFEPINDNKDDQVYCKLQRDEKGYYLKINTKNLTNLIYWYEKMSSIENELFTIDKTLKYNEYKLELRVDNE